MSRPLHRSRWRGLLHSMNEESLRASQGFVNPVPFHCYVVYFVGPYGQLVAPPWTQSSDLIPTNPPGLGTTVVVLEGIPARMQGCQSRES